MRSILKLAILCLIVLALLRVVVPGALRSWCLHCDVARVAPISGVGDALKD